MAGVRHPFSAALGNPFAENPLLSRGDLERAMLDLFEPLRPHFSPGRARVKLGSTAVLFGAECEELEGFARPLFGLVPLALGGGNFAHWGLFQEGLAHGTDPEHPEFWGFAKTDQRMVEMAALAFALIFLPGELWQPLSEKQRSSVVEWLGAINQHPLPNCNWHFFRVLVNLALESIGREYDAQALGESLRLIESHYDGLGYYHDGDPERVDYYVPWAYHTYGLIYATAKSARPDLAERYRERANTFASEFQHWFDASGRGIAFGRSMTYRFAQVALFSALVFADVEALPWGRVKGLILRHLRYWSTLPIFDRDGVLSLGYGYSAPQLVEPYSSSGSPYWCTKAFLALAQPEQHPFWQAPEESARDFDTELSPLRSASKMGATFVRGGGHVTLLSAGQHDLKWPHSGAKYGKFAYSSAFAHSVTLAGGRHEQLLADSMLCLREPGEPFRVRETAEQRVVRDGYVFSRWAPWPDVLVETLLIAGEAGWHQRLHRIQSARPLISAEQGFCLGRGSDQSPYETIEIAAEAGGAVASTRWGQTGIWQLPLPGQAASTPGLWPRRTASIHWPQPGSHLLHPRTILASLAAELEPGTSWLGCAVFAAQGTAPRRLEDFAGEVPQLPGAALSFFG